MHIHQRIRNEILTLSLVSISSKIHRGLSAYKTNTGLDHPSAYKRATEPDPLIEVGNGQLWFGSISVGYPAANFTGKSVHTSATTIFLTEYAVVDFDTGSSDLFLPASTCGSTCAGHKKYIPASSSASVALGKSFSLKFGDGSTVSGDLFADTVEIAGFAVRLLILQELYALLY